MYLASAVAEERTSSLRSSSARVIPNFPSRMSRHSSASMEEKPYRSTRLSAPSVLAAGRCPTASPSFAAIISAAV
jgi:hypothetical protein